MEVVHVPADAPPTAPPEAAVTIGNFDGVHRGHRQLIERVIRHAREMGIRSAIVTFDPHPRSVIRPDQPLALLTTLRDRLEVFDRLGLDLALVWRFDAAVQHLSPDAFHSSLGRYLQVRLIVHGPGFAVGERRRGTPAVLAEIGRGRGFGLEEVAPIGSSAAMPTPAAEVPVQREGTPSPHHPAISSTAIRRWIEHGEVSLAAAALGRPPSLTGVVEAGERVGRTLGYPTANLRLEGTPALPADGVYAGWAEVSPYGPRARRYPAAVSVGVRPTFDGARRVVEAYLLDFSGNLYEQQLRLHFVARLRGQQRFESVDGLIAQMARDVAATPALLASGGEEGTLQGSTSGGSLGERRALPETAAGRG